MKGRMRGAGVLIAAMALAVAGCGSSGSSGANAGGASSTASSASGGSGGNTQAAQLVAQYQTVPATAPVPSLAKAAPSGKRIDYVTCALASCSEFAAAFQSAAKTLGWQFRVIQTDITPAAINSALQKEVQEHPDGIIINALVPKSSLSQSLSAIESAGIPFATTGSDPSWGSPSGDYLATAFGPVQAIGPHKLLAAWVAADSGGKAHVAYFYDPSIGEIQEGEQAFFSTLPTLCTKCTLTKQQMSQTAIGTSFPGQVVSFLQAHSEINYVALPFGSADLGVPSAIAAAGLATKVKILSFDASTETIKAILAGQEAVTTAEPNTNAAFSLLNVFARKFLNEPIGTAQNIDANLPYELLTKQTLSGLPNPTAPWETSGLQSAFARAWGVKQ